MGRLGLPRLRVIKSLTWPQIILRLSSAREFQFSRGIWWKLVPEIRSRDSRPGVKKAPTVGQPEPVFLCARSDLSGGDGARLLLRDLFLCAKSVFEVVAVFAAARLVEFIRALADLDFKLLRFAHCRRCLLGRIFGHGILLFAAVKEAA
jgi:hypothetical protein